ncbi:MAG TPA: YdeI/OmpD-associated family protein [Cyclobacteriaceae bacterium]|nr:YdeI/OmpD-associated family protein [Cyclobacteriaceae bacterium]
MEKPNEFYAKDRAAWRKWLTKNHLTEKKCWLILYNKNSGTRSVLYAEAVEEALCFGWIDSKGNKRDDKSFFLSFAPRKSKSVWSKINKERIESMIQEGRMTTVGMEKIKQAKADGSWTRLDAIDALQMPADLARGLSRNKKAKKYFDAFPPSAKKIIFFWIESAKRPETKAVRVSETVAWAAKNIRANQWRPKK